MVDRQDIDALLISALYGELTPADEARLTTHLESHPADKSALGLLTETRAAFRDSGFAGLQVDPPQAISALLLQEAARRAPKRVLAPKDDREQAGWFARFVNSFARHPAMAAAAMIVLVAGVGGLIYTHQGGGSFAEQTDDRAASPPTETAVPTPSAGSSAVAFGLNAGSGSAAAPAIADPAFRAGDKVDSYRVELADGATPPATGKINGSGSGSVKPVDHAGMVLNTPSPQPKDLGEGEVARDEKQKTKLQALEKETAKLESKVVQQTQAPKKAPAVATVTPEQTTAPGRAGGGAGTNGRLDTTSGYYKNDVANGSASNAVVAPDVQKPQAPPTKANTTNTTNANDAAVLAWAKDQHKRVTDYVRANNCNDAAKVAAQIAARANDYYNTNVANDRALKACLAYINDQREKDAERTQKARAQKKVDANEVSPAPPANIAK